MRNIRLKTKVLGLGFNDIEELKTNITNLNSNVVNNCKYIDDDETIELELNIGNVIKYIGVSEENFEERALDIIKDYLLLFDKNLGIQTYFIEALFEDNRLMNEDGYIYYKEGDKYFIENPYINMIKKNNLIEKFKEEYQELEAIKSNPLTKPQENKENLENYIKLYRKLIILGIENKSIKGDEVVILDKLPANKDGISIYEVDFSTSKLYTPVFNSLMKYINDNEILENYDFKNIKDEMILNQYEKAKEDLIYFDKNIYKDVLYMADIEYAPSIDRKTKKFFIKEYKFPQYSYNLVEKLFNDCADKDSALSEEEKNLFKSRLKENIKRITQEEENNKVPYVHNI